MKVHDRIKERVQIGLRISEPDYFVGLLYLLNCLIDDFFRFAEEEERMKGIMLKYQEDINRSFLDYFGENMNEERYDLSGRIVFLYKNVIYYEYQHLTKKLSKADRVLVIVRRIFEFMYERKPVDQQDAAINRINEITKSIYDNIRWRQKKADLCKFLDILSTYFNEGYIGKQTTWKFSIIDEQNRFERKYHETSESEVLVDETNEQISIGL